MSSITQYDPAIFSTPAFAPSPDPFSDDLSSILNPWIEEAPPEEKDGRLEATSRIRNVRRRHYTIGEDANRGSLYLSLSNLKLSKLPSGLFALIENLTEGGLVQLSLSGNRLTAIPSEIRFLPALKNLHLSGNQLTDVSSELIGFLPQLEVLNLFQNQLTDIPLKIFSLSKLEELSLSTNALTKISCKIGRLSTLKKLYLSGNQLTEIPLAISRLSALEDLSFNNNKLTTIPPIIGSLHALKEINVSDNQLTDVPSEMGSLPKLKKLFLHRNLLTDIPPEMMQLQHSCQVNLTECPLSLTARVRIQKEISAAGYNGPKVFHQRPTPKEVVGVDLLMKYWFLLAQNQKA